MARGVAAKEEENVRMGWAVPATGRATTTGCFAAVNADIVIKINWNITMSK
jgi:hypothetical protein